MKKKAFFVEVYKDGKGTELTGIHTIVALNNSDASIKAVDYLYFSQMFGLVKYIVVKNENGNVVASYKYDERTVMAVSE